MQKKEFVAPKSKKLVSLIQDFGFSFADTNKMLRNKDVKVNGKPTKENILVDEGDQITIFYNEEMLKKKFDVVEETDDYYIIYKYAGIESAGENGIEKVLDNAIAVHRLDRNTEGLMIFVKNEKTSEKLKNGTNICCLFSEKLRNFNS